MLLKARTGASTGFGVRRRRAQQRRKTALLIHIRVDQCADCFLSAFRLPEQHGPGYHGRERDVGRHMVLRHELLHRPYSTRMLRLPLNQVIEREAPFKPTHEKRLPLS